MVKTFRFHEYGGPEVLKYEDVMLGAPGPGEVRLRHHAVGVNFIDVYFRTGLYPIPGFPSGLGHEAAGVIEAVGEGVAEFKPGDRVAYGTGPLGSYAQARLIPAAKIVKLPDRVDFKAAAAAMLKGLTAQYLLRRTYRVQPGDAIVIHAAAGGVGLIVSQWAKALGATVIGTVGADEKVAVAKAGGCDHVINYTTEDFAARVREITDGEGVPVVYDSLGRATFEKSLDCLRPLGMMVAFGNSTGPVPPVDPLLLMAKGSLFLTRPSLMTYMSKRADLVAGAAELFDVMVSGAVKIAVNHERPLSEAAAAHRDLEARRTTGSTILLP